MDLPFHSPVSSVYLSLDMSSTGEGMYTPNSSMMTVGVTPLSGSTLRHSASTPPPSPSAQVVNPSAASNVIGESSGMVIGILSVPYTSYPFMQNAQSGLSGSTSFVEGFPWNGTHSSIHTLCRSMAYLCGCLVWELKDLHRLQFPHL